VRTGRTVSEWWLLVAAAVAQMVVAAALRATSLPATRAGARRWRPAARFLIRGSEDTIVWAIEAGGRRLGRLSTCLTRALAGELLLDSNAAPVTLTIGVRRTDAGTLEAHAWLARNGRVLLGGTSDGYVPLVNWTGPVA
jgi:transglutaminase superfamily protein